MHTLVAECLQALGVRVDEENSVLFLLTLLPDYSKPYFFSFVCELFGGDKRCMGVVTRNVEKYF
jgi:hypothetical protein